MKEYQIWQEGYLCTGMEGIPSPAFLVGKSQGKDFNEACLEYFNKNPNTAFNYERLTVWGCKLYDNEQDARKTYG